MTINQCLSYGASDTITFTSLPFGTWVISVNEAQITLEILNKNSFSEIYTFFYTYNIHVSVEGSMLVLKNKSQEIFNIYFKNITNNLDSSYNFNTIPESNGSINIITTLEDNQLVEFSFYLASNGINFLTECVDGFQIPDTSCNFPIVYYLNDNYNKVSLYENIGTNDLILYLKNKNKINVSINIFNISETSAFKDSLLDFNNKSNKITDNIFQTCLKGNGCLPISCIGSGETTGLFDIKEVWDLIIEDNLHLKNSSVIDIIKYLNETEEFQVVFEPISCIGATINSGFLDIDGNWDLVIDDKISLENATPTQIATYLNASAKFEVTLNEN